MSNNDKQGIQEQDLRALEVRVEELIRACTHLKDENKTLRAREQELLVERDKLANKNDQAKTRVEDMISRLKKLEDEA
ncbi:TIGR02449 family protein [Thiosocius teredinicola]|uniref:TIGR02449 family protein n=1 Tax=Thiosocius teredinicola TaxID=1973002 RepID=UPI0009912EF1